MPSTETTPTLVISYRRAEVVGFWIVGTAVSWLLTSLAAAALDVQRPWAWATAAALSLVLPGVFWRPWFETGVWSWNGSVRRVAAALRTYVLAVCYYLLFSAVGAAGASLELTSGSDASRWRARDHQSGRQRRRSSRTDAPGDHHDLSAFALTAGNWWAISLFPLVFLLTLLRDEQLPSAVPNSTYTLY